MKRIAGLTVLEVMLALAITVLTLAMGVPMMQDFVSNQKMNGWMSGLRGVLHFAREQAVIRRQRIAICASRYGEHCDAGVQWQQGVMVFADHNGDRKRQAEEPVLRLWQMDASGLQVHTSRGRKVIRYLPNGTSPGSNARITVCDRRGPEQARAVVIGNTGRIRSERADRGARIRCQ